MFKSIRLLVGVLALTSTNLAFAKAGSEEPVIEFVTTLRIIENDKPPVLVDLSDSNSIVISGDSTTVDSVPGSLSQTTIFEGKVEVTATNSAGKKYFYKNQSGTLVLTTTSIKAKQKPQAEVVKNSKP